MAALPDNDPDETNEWLEALDGVLEHEGPERAHYILEKLIDKARRSGAYLPYSANTAYINTIPASKDLRSPGDPEIEHRIRSYVRWNAAAMVLRANKHTNVGGHIASFASAATLYDVGFNHFWHAPSEKHGGDLVFVQGHSATGVYARAYMLGRLTDGQGRLDAMTAQALQRVAFNATAGHILTLGELCDLTAGRVPLVIELKGTFAGDDRLASRTSEVLASYSGPVAAMSFDPGLMAAVRRLGPTVPLGLVAMRRAPDSPATAAMPPWRYARQALAARPQFLAYRVQDLTTPPPLVARHVLRMPVLTWTVCTPADRAQASRYADQMIFEGFRP